MAHLKEEIVQIVGREWASFVSSTCAYVVVEAVKEEAKQIFKRYGPLVSFEIHPIASVS